MGIMAGIGGLVGGLSGLFGGGTTQPPPPPTFQMPGLGGAASNLSSGIQSLAPWTSAAQGSIAPAQSTFGNLYNNPYAGGFQQGAGVAGAMGQNAALGQYGAGGAVAGAGLGTFPWASQLMMTGFDPQQALYGRTVQQLQDQVRAGEEARGIAMTPYGAGLENQALSNFNIDWQNQQLQRQLQAAQGYGGLLSQGGNLVGLGTGLQAQAPGQYLTGSSLPYSTYAGIGGQQNQAIQSLLANLQGGQNVAQQPLQDWSSYLGTGLGFEGTANQVYGNQLAAQRQGFGEQQLLGSALGGSMYGLGQTPWGRQFGLAGSDPLGWSRWGGGGGGTQQFGPPSPY